MRKLVRVGPRLGQSSFQRWIETQLQKIQQAVPPEAGRSFVVINMTTDEYVIGKTPGEAMAAFDARWPDAGFFRCRLDGGPFTKLYGCRQ
jgi:hypothetical protein